MRLSDTFLTALLQDNLFVLVCQVGNNLRSNILKSFKYNVIWLFVWPKVILTSTSALGGEHPQNLAQNEHGLPEHSSQFTVSLPC